MFQTCPDLVETARGLRTRFLHLVSARDYGDVDNIDLFVDRNA